MPVYLIQGFFFQNQQWLGIGVGSEGEWPAAVIRSGLCQFMYSGVIFPEQGELAGHMSDHFGESMLFKVQISPNEVGFSKKYERRQDIVDYKFSLQNGLWVGGYSGPTVGKGGAKCVITEVSEHLFTPIESPERI